MQEYKVKALARSYMPYTQGTLTMMKFNPNTAEFYALFNYSDSAIGETIAYLNQEYWYPSGPNA